MKKLFYIGVIAMIVASCSTGQYTTGRSYEDDLYYNPKEKPLVIQEVEKELPDVSAQEKNELLEIAKKSVKEAPEKYPDITNVDRIEIESVEYKTNPETGAIDTIIEIMSQGYWINGFEGSKAELEEAMRVIDQYPNGFGYFSHGNSIGENLAFDSDWNVYTRDGKYWWFPRVTNLTMYNQFMFGRYPRYEWTVIWDSPHYDYWDFDYHFGYSSYWRWRHYDRWHFRTSWYDPYWYSPSWRFGVGFGVNPWYNHNHWYDYPYYRRHYKRHSDPNWYKSDYRYGPRRSMYTKTARTNTFGTRNSSSTGLKSVRRGTTTRSTIPSRRGSSTIKSGSTRVSTRGTGTKSRYRSTGSSVKSGAGTVTTRSRYSTQSRKTRSRTTTTKTTTQSNKSSVRRYSKPRSTTRPSYNRSRSGSTNKSGTSRTRTNRSYKRAPARSSGSGSGTYNKRSSGSYNNSGSSSSSKSRTYTPSSRSRSGSSGSSTRSSGSKSGNSSSRSRSRTR